jgi:hypothetical protein
VEPRSKVGRNGEVSPEEQNFPFCPSPCPLSNLLCTFGKHLIDVVDKFKTENDIVPYYKVNSHAVDTTLFDGKLSDDFRVMIFELEGYGTFGPVGTNQLDFDNFDLSRFVLFQIFLFDVSEESFLV